LLRIVFEYYLLVTVDTLSDLRRRLYEAYASQQAITPGNR
jgi:hypothetical protein